MIVLIESDEIFVEQVDEEGQELILHISSLGVAG